MCPIRKWITDPSERLRKLQFLRRALNAPAARQRVNAALISYLSIIIAAKCDRRMQTAGMKPQIGR